MDDQEKKDQKKKQELTAISPQPDAERKKESAELSEEEVEESYCRVFAWYIW